jgi:hypothetical protein
MNIVYILYALSGKHFQIRAWRNTRNTFMCLNFVMEKTVWRLYNLNKILKETKLVYELKQVGRY